MQEPEIGSVIEFGRLLQEHGSAYHPEVAEFFIKHARDDFFRKQVSLLMELKEAFPALLTKHQYCYDYPRPAVTVDVVVFAMDEWAKYHILTIRRGKEPFKGMRALPGGFLDENETSVQAALRELEEETGYNGSEKNLTFLKVCDRPDRDPRGRVISLAYVVDIGEMVTVKGGEWLSFADCLWERFAFDHHVIILTAMNWFYKNKKSCGAG